MLGFNSKAQTKQETIDWIEYKLESFPNIGVLDIEIDQFKFSAAYHTTEGSVSYSVDIWKIWSINFVEKENSIQLVLKTKGETDIEVMKINYDSKGGMESINLQNTLIVELSTSFKGNDRFARMRKAITNLVESSGGSVLKEVY